MIFDDDSQVAKKYTLPSFQLKKLLQQFLVFFFLQNHEKAVIPFSVTFSTMGPFWCSVLLFLKVGAKVLVSFAIEFRKYPPPFTQLFFALIANGLKLFPPVVTRKLSICTVILQTHGMQKNILHNMAEFLLSMYLEENQCYLQLNTTFALNPNRAFIQEQLIYTIQ